MTDQPAEASEAVRLRFDRPTLVAGTIAGLGAAIAIGVMEWFSVASHFPLAVIPFATSIVLVIGSPDAVPAQPRALVGGHLVSTLVGLLVLKLTGPGAWAAAAGVGLAVLADSVALPLLPVLTLFAALWYGGEALMTWFAGWPLSWRFLPAAILRDLMLPAVWAAGWWRPFKTAISCWPRGPAGWPRRRPSWR